MRELTVQEKTLVSGGAPWDPIRWEDEVPDGWAELYINYDIYLDMDQDGVADGVLEAGQTVAGTDEDNNEVPDIIDNFAMNYPPGD